MKPILGNITVEYIDMSQANTSEQQRILSTTSLAAISRGQNESKNPSIRYKALMKEAEGNKPSRPFEFLPIVLLYNNNIANNDHLIRFGHKHNNEFRTNMRAAIEAGIKYEDVPYSKTKDFIAFRITAPMFAWAQIVTHTQISTESQSDRVVQESRYWLPEDIQDKTGFTANDFLDLMLNYWSQNTVQQRLKKSKYKLEIYSRAPYYFKMKTFVMTGWLSDDLAWPHFLRERNAFEDNGIKNWTQSVTSDIAKKIREEIEKHHGEIQWNLNN